MQIFYSDTFVLPLPDGHRFPMQKYALLRQRVAAVGIGDLFVPQAVSDQELYRAHDEDYVRRVQRGELTAKEIRRIGFPWSAALVERSRRASGATLAACRAALDQGVGVNLAGGTHHAGYTYGEGFCVFNDSVVAARAMLAEGRVRHIAVVDCDVHQGNGTADICGGDAYIFTFSIHGANNFPFDKIPSHLDIDLDDATGDDLYLTALADGLAQTFDASHPDLVIYLAGADPYYDDRLGRLGLSKDGLAARDLLVFERCRSAGVPVAVTMAGGYARTITDTVDIHFETVRRAVGLVGG